MEGNGSAEDGVALRAVANGVGECEIDAVEDATRGNGDAGDKGRIHSSTPLIQKTSTVLRSRLGHPYNHYRNKPQPTSIIHSLTHHHNHHTLPYSLLLPPHTPSPTTTTTKHSLTHNYHHNSLTHNYHTPPHPPLLPPNTPSPITTTTTTTHFLTHH
ncbi:hypothetical protein Pcinc_021740 [Petrolisthes cinctipes]|uniref:Uncharacterized protein n=1 Tax=Petrolisthes cinctipes TaxID=88211 RepID=A0AAE1FF09_PETCI|nr:hypothetical protein Pcinc_021740 [Petrolisthes cinctipes]